jgi:hypothetical protein
VRAEMRVDQPLCKVGWTKVGHGQSSDQALHCSWLRVVRRSETC